MQKRIAGVTRICRNPPRIFTWCGFVHRALRGQARRIPRKKPLTVQAGYGATVSVKEYLSENQIEIPIQVGLGSEFRRGRLVDRPAVCICSTLLEVFGN
jgi:hypothetical protein